MISPLASPPSRGSAQSCLPRGPRHLRRSPISFLFPSLSFPRAFPSPRRGGGNPGFNPFPYNFLPMHREKLARNMHAHARTPRENPSCSRSFIGGHRLLDFIEFSSSARRHPVQTRIRQLTPLAWGIRN